jgi:hypothetical protein
MSTLRQIEANRRNAQKSTGPTSATGKAVSSMNALKTGLHAKSIILPFEKRADLELLIQEHYDQHRPATPEARLLVDDLIYNEWNLRRFRNSETQMYEYQNYDDLHDYEPYPLGKSATLHARAFTQLQWRMDSARRNIFRILKALDELKAKASAGPPAVEPASLPPSPQNTSPQIGFVPGTPVTVAAPTPLRLRPAPLLPPANHDTCVSVTRLRRDTCEDAIC